MEISDALPGAELIREGFTDLARGVESIPALLVLIGAPRLRELGFDVPDSPRWPEDRLYDLLAAEDSNSAHSRYNALTRTLVSFERAAACGARPDERSSSKFMRGIAAEANEPGRIFSTDAAAAVLNIKILPESDRLLRAIPDLKERLHINVELAAPSDFIPELPGWQERSAFVAQEGKISFHHYDFYAQALAKIERGHRKDREDVDAMIAAGFVGRRRLLELFEAIEPQLYRYPAIDPGSFRAAVEKVVTIR